MGDEGTKIEFIPDHAYTPITLVTRRAAVEETGRSPKTYFCMTICTRTSWKKRTTPLSQVPLCSALARWSCRRLS